MSIPLTTAFIAVFAWVSLVAYALHYTVESDGSWYNDLKINGNDTYFHRFKFTIENRVIFHRWVLVTLLGSVGIWIIVYIFMVGLTEVL